MWAMLIPILLPIVEHGGIGLAMGIITYSQTHDFNLAAAAFATGAGLSAKPNNVLAKLVAPTPVPPTPIRPPAP